MLYSLRYRDGICYDVFIEAENQPEADWRGHAVCAEKGWRFVYVKPALVADSTSHPMPKEAAAKVTARVGA